MVSVNKGDWDKGNNFDDIYHFNAEWIKESYRVLKPGGTLWVSGTYHNIYIIGSIISSFKDFRILNNITWVKTAPPPNLSCRFFTHSTETILWIRKGQKDKTLFQL
jgi:site-specific DNA-methyltransferase (adenine-specific)